MRKSLVWAVVTGLMLVAFGYAHAADLPVKGPVMVPVVPAPVYNWTGFYAGINGGAGWQSENQTLSGSNTLSQDIINSGFIPSSISTRGAGGMFGGQIGYNYQINQFVFGAEFDFDWSGVNGSSGQALALGKASLTSLGSVNTNWMSTIRARAGYLISPTTLVYVTGGGAFADVEANTTLTLATPIKVLNGQAVSNNSSTEWGWTIGAGLEQKIFNNNWSIKAEYLYTDLGSININPATTIGKTNVTFIGNQDLRYQTFKVGLNYKFY